MRTIPPGSVFQVEDNYMGWSLYYFRKGGQYELVTNRKGAYFFYDIDEAWDYAKSCTVPKEWDSVVVKAVTICKI